MKITLVIPTKNEEKLIAKRVKEVKPFCNEVLVVDARSSKDKTRDIAKKLGATVVVDNGKGHGAAKRIALKEAKHDIVVFFDADGSHIAKDIPKIVKPIKEGKADLVIASRMWGGSDEIIGDFSSFMRTWGSNIVALVINYRFNVRISDYENGFRAIKKDVGLSLGLNANDFDIEQEMAMKCLKRKFKILEVPSHENCREHGRSNISLPKIGYKFVWRLLRELF
jgi:dolichol-phosphate mannosyltransferase